MLGTAAAAAEALPLEALGDPPAVAPSPRADPPERIPQPREFTGAVNGCVPGPRSTRVVIGVFPGRRGVYHRELAFQWIDVSDTAPGRYVPAAESDPTTASGRGRTGPAPPTFADAEPVVVPGHVAPRCEPHSHRPRSGGGPGRVALSAAQLRINQRRLAPGVRS